MTVRQWIASAAVAGYAAAAPAAEPAAPAPHVVYSFSALKAARPEAVKARLEAWLRAAAALDQGKVDAIWADDSRPVLDRTADTIALGLPATTAALAEAADPFAPAPTAVPAVLTDPAVDPFVRANLAAAYQKALAGRKVYEESLAAVQGVAAEHLVDPAAFLFYKAVAEHALMQREAALKSIGRLLDDVADAPDRYRLVATLLFFDLQGWAKDPKDLSNIARLQDNSGRRLDLARGGEHTQDIQKKIVFRLDEALKELEKQAQQQSGSGGGGGQGQPGGSTPGQGSNRPSSPPTDYPTGGGPGGPGEVDDQKLRKYAETWGTLPAADRAKAVQEITRDLPAKYKPMIEEYFKSLNRVNGYDR